MHRGLNKIDHILQATCSNSHFWAKIQMSLKCLDNNRIDNKSALITLTAWSLMSNYMWLVRRGKWDVGCICGMGDWNPGPVSLRLMTSQFKDIVYHTQKLKSVKCTFCGVWVPNLVSFEVSHKIWNPYTAKFASYKVVLQFYDMSYDILELWHLKS